ncbi:hypothetical protein A9Q99_07475 [Gammaproteobacteria bacterium 45_16_T64]|nr:hypothetical protein A9Q99_07475 [Gammaproteobacteria bacterium 45_16_T64]
MKKISILLSVAAMLGASGCKDNSNSTDSQSVSRSLPTTQEAMPVIPAAPAKLVDYTWPDVSESEPIELADDALAVNYYVILDGSGSMESRKCAGNSTKMEVAKQALAAFSGAIPATANLGMLAFDQRGINERLPLGQQNRPAFIDEVNRVTATSSTPLKTALNKAFKKLTEQGKKQLGYGEYHLVVVTDGDASVGENPTHMVDEIYQDSPVILHTIGFCIDQRHSLNQPGKTYYKSADNPEALKAGLENVLAELDAFGINEFN